MLNFTQFTLRVSATTLVGVLIFSPNAIGAIFGVDDRIEANISSPWRDPIRSTAVAVLSGNLEEQPDGNFKLLTGDHTGSLCSEEKFSEDPYLAYACTGFLVAPDLLVTAGHCASNVGVTINEEKMYCEVYSWLFDFRKDSLGQIKTEGITKDDLYRCRRIIFAVIEEKAPFRDFALIQLDRPVTGNRKPFKLADGGPRKADILTMIGHPLGMPAKVTRNGKVLVNDPTKSAFVTNLDALAGNSGSPVINWRNEVVGILVGGSPSLNYGERPGSEQKCSVYNRCDDAGANCLFPDSQETIGKLPGFQRVGSDVQRIDPIIELIKTELNSRSKSMSP